MAVHSEVTTAAQTHQIRLVVMTGIAIDMMDLGTESAP